MTYPPPRDQTGPDQRNVWDFPRPPAVEQWGERVEIVLGGVRIATTDAAWCVLETSHPPTYYLPWQAFLEGSLRPAAGSSYCEWKGVASYVDVLGGGHVASRAGWTYPDPVASYAVLRDHVAVYCPAMDSCLVDGVPVEPQPGGFYGGWVTPRVAGPFKGSPGTMGW